MTKIETSNVPLPKSKIRTFFSLPLCLSSLITLKGQCFISDWTVESSNRRPIRRLASKIVLLEFTATWFFAASPIKRSLSLNATYDGLVQLPWSLAIISTLPFWKTPTQEYLALVYFIFFSINQKKKTQQRCIYCKRQPFRICLPKLLFRFAFPASHIITPTMIKNMREYRPSQDENLTSIIGIVFDASTNRIDIVRWYITCASRSRCWYAHQNFHFRIGLCYCAWPLIKIKIFARFCKEKWM